jgi:hypothetical protein
MCAFTLSIATQYYLDAEKEAIKGGGADVEYKRDASHEADSKARSCL